MKENEIMKVRKFGNFIKDRMQERGITMKQFAHDSGLSYGYISNVIHARRGIPKPNTIKKISSGLGLSNSTVFNEAGMEYFSKGEPYIEKKKVDDHEIFSYKGKKIDDADMKVIQRILDTLPDK